MGRKGLAAVAALLVLAAVLAPPASAGARPPEDADIKRCSDWASFMGTTEVCIHNDGQGGRYGTIQFIDTTGEPAWVDGVIAIDKCQTDMDPCSVEEFTSGSGWTGSGGYWALRSGTTPASYGWVFRACGNYTAHHDGVSSEPGPALCSPWMTGDPKGQDLQIRFIHSLPV